MMTPTFRADLSDQQVFGLAAKIEQAQRDEMPTIRACLALLARSSEQVALRDAETVDVFLELLESVTDVIQRKRALIDLLETSQARLLVLLQPWAEAEGQP